MLWQYRRIALYAAAALAVVALAWRVVAWRHAYHELPAVEERLALEVTCGEGSECLKRQAALEAELAAKTTEVVENYEQELAVLRDRPVPVRTVRVCPDPGNVQGAVAPGSVDGTSTPAAGVSGAPGRDIGPDLYQLARDADEVAARLRALQEWNAALAR